MCFAQGQVMNRYKKRSNGLASWPIALPLPKEAAAFFFSLTNMLIYFVIQRDCFKNISNLLEIEGIL